jgi:hypothetical protein
MLLRCSFRALAFENPNSNTTSTALAFMKRGIIVTYNLFARGIIFHQKGIRRSRTRSPVITLRPVYLVPIRAGGLSVAREVVVPR